jgi:signal transduction histidine kinase
MEIKKNITIELSENDVKKIITAHKGYIFIDSEIEKYTRFSIFLPTNPTLKQEK